MTTLRIGLIGYGARAASLARELGREGNDAVVAVVCDPSERSRREAGEAYPEARITADLADLIGSDVDAVMVLTPDDLHADPIVAALEAGKAVFSEKPLAITVEDADRVLAAAKRTGSRLYVGHNMRHMPVITLMKRLIDEGAIGEVKAVWCRHFVGHGGDFYFKDWHADRSRVTSLLLQKGAHDIDVIHWLAGGYTRTVAAMGDNVVYGGIEDRQDRSDQRMWDWFSLDNWPPTELTGLNPVVDVEDISQVNMRLDNGVLASYEQCHFTPDYWRNYTVIGTRGRLENFGDEAGQLVGVWNRRHRGWAQPDETHAVPDAEGGHGGADSLLIREFLRFVREGGRTDTSPVAAREAVVTGVLAAQSLRGDGSALPVPPLPAETVAYFDNGQV
ncbi:Gfo/Idh/MocA family oxidoreductase [Propioniciclava coleopterorum]|uniref:Gfo/Idh/MocA family oxidoreductase n=1 Tax=Propioniciclava coleopterorum TaxID=2714937 RepID=A0A6G7Y488_9ACTN|nr:Gfo/Idh/MocA family oxidoreductase [Propioniciclava coleopterorum]QIK71632.1 Gfo/Idh/MocA family oxidoreductase [Propioniciclava coleopterorum]